MLSNVAVKNSEEIRPVLIVLTGRTFPEISRTEGDFDDWIAARLGNATPHVRIDARDPVELPAPENFAGVVISGSHAMVTDHEPWSERLARWLEACVGAQVPVLAICYGHHLLAYALGGRVGDRPDGVEIGTKDIELADSISEDPLFESLPKTFPAQLVHAQSVLELPPHAKLLARSENERHQAFRVGTCAWGVQFHPEFSSRAMRGYVDLMARSCDAEQSDGAGPSISINETPEAACLLKRFVTLALRPHCRQPG